MFKLARIFHKYHEEEAAKADRIRQYRSEEDHGQRGRYKSWMLQGSAIVPCFSGVPLNDRGFRYGQHLFETIATRGGHVLFLEEHLQKLSKEATQCGFPFAAVWHDYLTHFFNATKWEDGLIRIYLTAGEGAPASSIIAPQVFLFWEETTFPSPEELEQGIALVSLEQPMGNFMLGAKTGNYWEHLRALKTAREQGGAEGLVFDAAGFLVSATMANVICWFEKKNQLNIITPPPTRGAREGVVLGWVREQLPEIVEGNITRDDLLKVKAIALTNSRLGVMPVAKFDGRRLLQLKLSLRLAKSYRKERMKRRNLPIK